MAWLFIEYDVAREISMYQCCVILSKQSGHYTRPGSSVDILLFMTKYATLITIIIFACEHQKLRFGTSDERLLYSKYLLTYLSTYLPV